MNAQRVHAVEIRNFKRLRAVDIRFESGATVISGRNANGKSSALDSIAAVLGGSKLCPENPIRDGENHASVKAELTDYQAIRTWDREEDGSIKSELRLYAKNGSPVAKPQLTLDALIGTGRSSFHPFDFVAMSGDAKGRAEQAAILCKIAGYDPGPLDGEKERVNEQRKVVNKEVKRLEGVVAESNKTVRAAPPEPGQIVDQQAIADRYTAANRKKMDNESARQRVSGLEREAQVADSAVARLEEDLLRANRTAQKAHAALEKAAQEAKALVDPDIAPLEAAMKSAQADNAKVNAAREAIRAHEAAVLRHNERVADLDHQRSEAGRLTLRLEAIDREKAAALAAAKFPIPGLSVEGGRVTFQGVDFATGASGAEQLRTSLSITAALNPGIRTIPVQERARLDNAGLRVVGQWAIDNDIDVILERVMEEPGLGIFIEDGGVQDVGPDAGRVPLGPTAARSTKPVLPPTVPADPVVTDDDLPTF